ncbi:MAG TPA: hypothetical protein VFW15_15555, partial [Thermoanaerobaculia bacterium]|nr:hypothetical protein [Thermoanaerobaculia bacterium]
SSILRDDPQPISQIEPMSPAALDHVVKKSLAKDPEDRWQSAADLGSELKWIAEGGSQTGAAAVAIPPLARRRVWPVWAAAALFALGLLGSLPFAIGYFRRVPAEGSAVKLSVLPPENTVFEMGSIALSPDGRRLAFVALGSDGRRRLWVRPLDSLDAQPLPGTEEASTPFWSPDGRFIGFFADQKLKKIDVSGGAPQSLCDARGGRGGTWNRDGTILFAPIPTDALYRIPAAGGKATPVTKLDPSRQENSHRWPSFLPDGRHFVYFARSRQRENRAIRVGSLDSSETRTLVNANSKAAFAPPGFLLYVREGEELVAAPFDPKRLEVTGDPTPVTRGVKPTDPVAAAGFTVSETGILAFGSGSSAAESRLAWLDRTGKQLATVGRPGIFIAVRLSPDQKRAALDLVDSEVGGRQIWVLDLARGVASRLSFGASQDVGPVWSPDGDRIGFSTDRDTPPVPSRMYQKPSSGTGGEVLLLESTTPKIPADWSSDGRFIVYESSAAGFGGPRDIWALPLTGERRPRPVLQTAFDEFQGTFSPDGRWIAYVSDETGKREVYVQGFPVSTGKWKISEDGGDQPLWRRDGKELFYLSLGGQLTAVALTPGSSTFEAGAARALFRLTRPQSGMFGTGRWYDAAADGQRFLVADPREGETSVPVNIFLGWAAQLGKK